MKKKRREHIASSVLNLSRRRDEEKESSSRDDDNNNNNNNNKIHYLNSDAKDEVDFRAYVAQIRDFLSGNFFHAVDGDASRAIRDPNI